MSFQYNESRRAFLEKEIDIGSGGDAVMVILCMSNTTADTETAATTVSGFTTLDEYDGANYPAGFANRPTIANQLVEVDAPNNRVEFKGDNLTYTSLGVGTRNAVGAVLAKKGTSDADSVPLFWVDTGGFPFAGTGSNVTIQWNAEGIYQFKEAA